MIYKLTTLLEYFNLVQNFHAEILIITKMYKTFSLFALHQQNPQVSEHIGYCQKAEIDCIHNSF